MRLEELADPKESAPKTVDWQGDGNKVSANFSAQGNQYKVFFIYNWFDSGSALGFDCWDINLRMENSWDGFSLAGNVKNPHEVYGILLGLVYAFVRDYNPQCLSMESFQSEMSPMYKAFYDKHLSKSYTLFHFEGGKRYFLRNDLLEAHKNELGVDPQKLHGDWSEEAFWVRKQKVASRKPAAKTAAAESAPRTLESFSEWLQREHQC